MGNVRMALAAICLTAWTLPCSAGEGTAWRETRSFAAEESHQAAAAEGDHVYAITNDRIARYDRRSGKRLATSTGDAEHLNSGFIWQGKLYCAHSNYPHTPELSQIKALDLETMQLTTFHDFGDFGGSLTWVVRRDDAWWCNFARYDQHNAETFLVRLNDDWKEMGRWTYPREVVERLGDRSISGGVFDGDEILATDHDNRWLYRLRVPDGKWRTRVRCHRGRAVHRTRNCRRSSIRRAGRNRSKTAACCLCPAVSLELNSQTSARMMAAIACRARVACP